MIAAGVLGIGGALSARDVSVGGACLAVVLLGLFFRWLGSPAKLDQGAALAEVDHSSPAEPVNGGFVWKQTGWERACPRPECSSTIRIESVAAFDRGELVCPACAARVTWNPRPSTPFLWHPMTEPLRERERAARQERLVQTYGAETANAIVAGRPFAGATPEIVREMFGEPENVQTVVLKKGVRVTYRYHQIGLSSRYGTRVRFTNGLCDEWKVAD